MNIRKFGLKSLVAACTAMFSSAASADPATILFIAASSVEIAGVIVSVKAIAAATVMVYGASRQRSKAKKAMAAARASAVAAMQDRYATVLTSTPPLQTVYGTATVGSSIHAMFTSNKTGQRSDGTSYIRRDAIHHLVYVFTCHEVSAVRDIKIGGQSCFPLDASGYSANSAFRMPTAAARYAEINLAAGATHTSAVPILSVNAQSFSNDSSVDVTASITIAANRLSITNTSAAQASVQITFGESIQSAVRIQIHTGSPTQTVNTTLNTLFPDKWTANHRIRGRFYVVASVDLEFPAFQSGPPELTADVDGKVVYDPRTATNVFSANNALCIGDYLRSPLGARAALADINSSYWIAGANACDTAINVREDSYANAITYSFSTNGNSEGWGAANGVTGVVSGGTFTLTHSGPDGHITNTTTFVGSARRYIRMRIRRTQGQGWRGVAQYSTGAHSFSDQFQKRIEAGLALNAWTELVWDMHSLDNGGPDWKNNNVTAVRLMLGSDANDRFEIDWIALSSYSEVTVSRPKYTLNGVITSDMDRERVLSDMAESMAGYVYNTGEWIIVPGYWTASVQTISDDDLDGNISVIRSDTPWEDLLNSCRALYYPTGSLSAVDMEPAYVNSTLVTTDGQELWGDIQLPYTNTPQRARNLARIRVEQSRNGQVFRIPLQLTALRLRVGDRFTLNNTEYGIVDKVYRVTDYSLDISSPVSLIVEEDTALTYDEADLLVGDPTPNSYLPPPYLRVPVTGVQVFSGTQTMNILGDGTAQSRVQVVWTPPTDALLLSGDGMLLIEWRVPLRDAPDAWRETLVPADAGSAYLVGPQGGELVALRLSFRTSSVSSGELRYAFHIVREISSPAFAATRAWNFNTVTVEGWTATGASLTPNVGGWLNIASTSLDPMLISPTIAVSGAQSRRLRMRVKRTAGSGWQGQVYYTTTGHGYSASFTKILPAALLAGQWVILEWDMSTLDVGGSDWITSTITQIRFDLGTTAADAFDVDWVAVGYVGPSSDGAVWGVNISGVPDNVTNATTDVTLIADGPATVSGNVITKTGTATAWDTGVRSRQSYKGGFYAEWIPTSTTHEWIIGANTITDLTDPGFATIDRAMGGVSGGVLRFYQSGGTVAQTDTFAAGDVLGIKYDGYRLEYIKNGVVLRTEFPSSALATAAWFFDAALRSPGTIIQNIRFVGSSQVSDLVLAQIAASENPQFLNSYQIIGQNLLPESDQMVRVMFAAAGETTASGVGIQVVNGAVIAGPGDLAIEVPAYQLLGSRSKLTFLRQDNRHTGTAVPIFDPLGNSVAVFSPYRFTVPVKPGDRMAAALDGNGHRCYWQVAVLFFTAAGSQLLWERGSLVAPAAAATNVLTALQRSEAVFVVPANAATAQLWIYKYNTIAGENGSYVFFGRPQLEVVAALAGASPYSSGPVGVIGTEQVVSGSATSLAVAEGTYTTGGTGVHDVTQVEASRSWTNSTSRVVEVYVVATVSNVLTYYNGSYSTITNAYTYVEYSVSGGGGAGSTILVDRAPDGGITSLGAAGAHQYAVPVNPGATITASVTSRSSNTANTSGLVGDYSLSITAIKL